MENYQREVTGRISPESPLQCDLQGLQAKLQQLQFPIIKQELLTQVGDEAIPCTGGDQHTLRELLAPLTKEQYNSVEDIQDAMAHPVRLAHEIRAMP